MWGNQRQRGRVFLTGAVSDSERARAVRLELIRNGYSVFLPGRLMQGHDVVRSGLEPDRDRRWVEVADLVLRLAAKDNDSMLDVYHAYECDKRVREANDYVTIGGG